MKYLCLACAGGRKLVAPSPRELARWSAYTLVLLAPGSFIVLPVLWLVRRFAVQASRHP